MWYDNKMEQGLVCRPSPSTVHKTRLDTQAFVYRLQRSANLMQWVGETKQYKKKRKDTRWSELQYTTIKALIYISWLTPSLNGLKIGWQKHDHMWLTTRAHSSAPQIDNKCKKKNACSHLATWLYELIVNEYRIPCLCHHSISGAAHARKYERASISYTIGYTVFTL